MYKVVFRQGSFIDYKGTQVNFILAAVSIPSSWVLVPVDEYGYELEGEEQVDITKILSIGISVQRPEDTWDEKLGKEIAYKKAVGRRSHLIATSDNGIINTKMVEATLEQEAAYMQINPGRYIAGYDDAKAKYLKARAQEDYLNNLSPEEKLAINVMASVKDPDKFLEAVELKRQELHSNHIAVNSNCNTILSSKAVISNNN